MNVIHKFVFIICIINNFYNFIYNFILNNLDTYAEGIEKLSLAEDTSNVDEAGILSNELREREKKEGV